MLSYSWLTVALMNCIGAWSQVTALNCDLTQIECPSNSYPVLKINGSISCDSFDQVDSKPTCENVDCSAEREKSVCVLKQVRCHRDSCSHPVVAKCVPVTTNVKCSPSQVMCPTSKTTPVIQANGCIRCDCAPTSVCNLFCITGYRCVLVDMSEAVLPVERPPCSSEPRCVPDNSSSVICSPEPLLCQEKYQDVHSDINGCKFCRFKGKTCESKRVVCPSNTRCQMYSDPACCPVSNCPKIPRCIPNLRG